MEIQHDAPDLSGAKPCPSCKSTVARDAVICIHCGYNFATNKKTGSKSWLAANPKLVGLAGGGLAVLIAATAFLLWPESAPPPPPFVPSPAVEKPARPPKDTPAPQVAAVETNAPEQAVEPPPPPEPTPEELAAQKAEAERLAREAEEARLRAEREAFEAKKAQAEQTLRQKLDQQEPLFQKNESVELRRRNGFIDKGTLTGFSGTGTNRVALIATATGQIGVPLVALDPSSRRRMDPEYREAFIQHVLNTKLPAPSGTESPE